MVHLHCLVCVHPLIQERDQIQSLLLQNLFHTFAILKLLALHYTSLLRCVPTAFTGAVTLISLLRFEWSGSDNLILKLLQPFPTINLEPRR